MTSLALAVAFVVVAVRRRRHRQPSSPAVTTPLRLALLIRIGLSAGLSLAATLAMVEQYVEDDTAELIRNVRRAGHLGGLTAALAGVADDRTRLFRLLADAHLSGAPMALAVSTFIANESDRLRTEGLYRARALPVRLTVPVALGLLPGFLLLAIAPQIVLAVRDLLFEVAGL